jgi:hypothetical protein
MLIQARLPLRGVRLAGPASSTPQESHAFRAARAYASPLLWLCALLLALAGLPRLSAATYYVAIWGDDSYNGTSSNTPFKNFSKAASVMRGGDTLNVIGGDLYYGTPQFFYRSGTSSARITIQSNPGSYATLYGDYVNSANNEGILTLGGDYITLKNMAFKRGKQIGVRFWSSSNCIIDGIVAEYNYTVGIAMDGDYNASSGDAGRARNANNTIKNCYVGYNVQVNKNNTLTTSQGWPSALAFYLGKDSTIDNCSSYNNYGEGIMMNRTTGSVINNCRATSNHSVNIYLDNANNCRVKYSTADGQVWGGNIQHGIANSAENYDKFELSPSGNIFENNTIKNARFGLIWVGTSGSGTAESHWAERAATSGWSWSNSFTNCTFWRTVGTGNSNISAQ